MATIFGDFQFEFDAYYKNPFDVDEWTFHYIMHWDQHSLCLNEIYFIQIECHVWLHVHHHFDVENRWISTYGFFNGRILIMIFLFRGVITYKIYIDLFSWYNSMLIQLKWIQNKTNAITVKQINNQ